MVADKLGGVFKIDLRMCTIAGRYKVVFPLLLYASVLVRASERVNERLGCYLSACVYLYLSFELTISLVCVCVCAFVSVSVSYITLCFSLSLSRSFTRA